MKNPSEGQVVVVFCPDYCPEQYQIVTYEDGFFTREPNGDMTKYVVDWQPIEFVEELF